MVSVIKWDRCEKRGSLGMALRSSPECRRLEQVGGEQVISVIRVKSVRSGAIEGRPFEAVLPQLGVG